MISTTEDLTCLYAGKNKQTYKNKIKKKQQKPKTTSRISFCILKTNTYGVV